MKTRRQSDEDVGEDQAGMVRAWVVQHGAEREQARRVQYVREVLWVHLWEVGANLVFLLEVLVRKEKQLAVLGLAMQNRPRLD